MKDRIINYYGNINSNLMEPYLTEIVIDKAYGNNLYGDLLICGFNKLNTLIIGENSLCNVRKVKIANNKQLKTICCEENSFTNVASYEIASSCHEKRKITCRYDKTRNNHHEKKCILSI